MSEVEENKESEEVIEPSVEIYTAIGENLFFVYHVDVKNILSYGHKYFEKLILKNCDTYVFDPEEVSYGWHEMGKTVVICKSDVVNVYFNDCEPNNELLDKLFQRD
jgi:formylmethanofuran dehydrogenase subunit E